MFQLFDGYGPRRVGVGGAPDVEGERTGARLDAVLWGIVGAGAGTIVAAVTRNPLWWGAAGGAAAGGIYALATAK